MKSRKFGYEKKLFLYLHKKGNVKQLKPLKNEKVFTVCYGSYRQRGLGGL